MSVACFMLLAYESGMLEEINGVTFSRRGYKCTVEIAKAKLDHGPRSALAQLSEDTAVHIH